MHHFKVLVLQQFEHSSACRQRQALICINDVCNLENFSFVLSFFKNIFKIKIIPEILAESSQEAKQGSPDWFTIETKDLAQINYTRGQRGTFHCMSSLRWGMAYWEYGEQKKDVVLHLYQTRFLWVLTLWVLKGSEGLLSWPALRWAVRDDRSG